MPERQSHNSERRHSSLKHLVSNQLPVDGGARQASSQPGVERRGGGRHALVSLGKTQKKRGNSGSSLGQLSCGALEAVACPVGPATTHPWTMQHQGHVKGKIFLLSTQQGSTKGAGAGNLPHQSSWHRRSPPPPQGGSFSCSGASERER